MNRAERVSRIGKEGYRCLQSHFIRDDDDMLVDMTYSNKQFDRLVDAKYYAKWHTTRDEPIQIWLGEWQREVIEEDGRRFTDAEFVDIREVALYQRRQHAYGQQV